jgi:hypothetical protein
MNDNIIKNSLYWKSQFKSAIIEMDMKNNDININTIKLIIKHIKKMDHYKINNKDDYYFYIANHYIDNNDYFDDNDYLE